MVFSFTPRRLFGVFATAEMVTWAVLIAALLCRSAGVADVVPVAGGIHGFVFLSYVTAAVFTWINQQWKPAVGIMGLLLAVVPFATVPFEIYLVKRGLLAGGWRLAPGGQAPRSLLEHAQAFVLRRPVLSFSLLFALIVALFVTLLWLGPPVPKA